MERTRKTERVASKAGQLVEIASRKDLAHAGSQNRQHAEQ